MFADKEIVDAILKMRSLGNDNQSLEVKEAVIDLPKSLLETISAFSNMHGGTIILGEAVRNFVSKG